MDEKLTVESLRRCVSTWRVNRDPCVIPTLREELLRAGAQAYTPEGTVCLVSDLEPAEEC